MIFAKQIHQCTFVNRALLWNFALAHFKMLDKEIVSEC